MQELKHNEKGISTSKFKIFPEFYVNVIVEEDPIQLHIIWSGWSKPQMYHVIVEYGDYEQSEYFFLDAEQIKDRFQIDIPNMKSFSNILKECPNDMELGKAIRNL